MDIQFEIETMEGSVRLPVDLRNAQRLEVAIGGSRFAFSYDARGEKLNATLEVLAGNGALFGTLLFNITSWIAINYILMPAAVYGGNRVTVVDGKGHYPPKVPVGYRELEPPQLAGTIQHLSLDGGGCIDDTSAECAFPGIGLHFSAVKESLWILSGQGCEAGNYGYAIEESPGGHSLQLRISAPSHRRFQQFACNDFIPSKDTPFQYKQNDSIHIEISICRKRCEGLDEFFHQAFLLRNAMVNPGKLPDIFPYSEAARLLRERVENDNWWEEYGYFGTMTKSSLKLYKSSHHWQLGWVGGCLRTENLLFEGDEESQRRVEREWDVLFTKAQLPSGFFYSSACNGVFFHDWPNADDDLARRKVLVRKNADALLFLARQMLCLRLLGRIIKPLWIDGVGKCADAFARLWRRYGQFGYQLLIEEEEIAVGGGAGGAPAIAGLAMASELFGEKEYLDIAHEAVLAFAERYLHKGNVYGGVGDALQATDSESACSLLEAIMTVWEYTGDAALLREARFAADYLSTWIVSYDYDFPKNCTFGKMGMTTAGTVYANIQNRHSAPGFCSASGDALFKLYRATGDEAYAMLMRDVVHSLPQYLSREDRPICGLDLYAINERVNMGDWEGRDRVGEVFNCACWPEVSLLLSRTHIPGVYARTDTRRTICFDHVQAEWQDARLRISNPTDYPANVTVLFEDAAKASQPLKSGAWTRFLKIDVPSHGEAFIVP